MTSALDRALLLELDPDLGDGIPKEDWDAARRACRGEVLPVQRGRWETRELAALDDLVGVVIVDGALCREVRLRDRCVLELLGPGDVLQPLGNGADPRLGRRVELTAVKDSVLVVLRGPFVRAAAEWPSLLTAVQRRFEAQREAFAVQALIAHLPKAEHRILLTLYHLADRWGYITPEGTVVALALTHELLGQLTGTRRPTATLAVSTLSSEGSLRRLGDGSWLLTPAGERRVTALAHTAPSKSFGERLMLCRRSSETASEAEALRAEARQILAQRQAVS